MSSSPEKDETDSKPNLFLNKPLYKKSITTEVFSSDKKNILSKLKHNLINIVRKNTINSESFDNEEVKDYKKSVSSNINRNQEIVETLSKHHRFETSDSLKYLNLSDKNLCNLCDSLDNNKFTKNITEGDKVSDKSNSSFDGPNIDFEKKSCTVSPSANYDRKISAVEVEGENQEQNFLQISKKESNSILNEYQKRQYVVRGSIKSINDNKQAVGDSAEGKQAQKYLSKLKRSFTFSDVKLLDNDRNKQMCCEGTKLFPVILPGSYITKFWNFVIFILMIYSITVMPYVISFISDAYEPWTTIENISDLLFLCDMMITLNLAYHDNDNILIESRKKIFLRYLKSWFFIDLISSFPQNFVMDYSNNSYNPKYLKLTRISKLSRLLRLIKLIRMVRIFRKIEFIHRLTACFSINYGVNRLLSFLFTIIILSHLMGCLWYIIPQIYDPLVNWVTHNNLQDESTFRLYLFSIYWAFATIFTVGFGDVHAANNIEYIMSILWMLLGVGFFSFTIGTISSILVNMDTKENMLRNKLSTLNEFCKERKLSALLKEKLKNIFINKSHKNVFSWMDKQEIFTELPANIKCEISKSMREGFLKNILFFSNKDDEFIAMVVPFLIPFHFLKKEIIYKKQDQANGIFFLTSGRISFVNDNYIPFCTMVKGSYFGEICIILKQQNRMSTVISNEACETLTLASHIIVDIIYKEYPEIYEEMKYVSQERMKRNIQCEKKLNIKLNVGSKNSLSASVSISPEKLKKSKRDFVKRENSEIRKFRKRDTIKSFMNQSKRMSKIKSNSDSNSVFNDGKELSEFNKNSPKMGKNKKIIFYVKFLMTLSLLTLMTVMN